MIEMKDSGIAWIGMIPEDWEVKKLKRCIDEISEKNDPIKMTNILSLTKEKGVLPYEEKGNQGNKSKDDLTQYKLAYKDTIVANSMNIIIGSVGISQYDGCVSPVYYVFKNKANSDIRFLNYLLTTTEFQKQLRRYANGILEIRLRISSDNLKGQKIPIPPLLIQKKIADYLDRTTSEMNILIMELQEEIEILEDYKKSVITETVTKGLDPDVEMKDSGNNVIGKIPVHWEYKKVKYACQTRNEKYTALKGKLDYFALENIVSWNSEYIQTENEYTLDDTNLCYKGDVVFGKLRPYLAKTFLVDYDRCCSTEFAVFCNFQGISKYFLYVFTEQGFIKTVDDSTSGVKMPRANIDFIKNIFIPVAPVEEQIQIVKFLESRISEIDAIILEKKEQLNILEEYKKTLIYEYVTGKKEVPDNE